MSKRVRSSVWRKLHPLGMTGLLLVAAALSISFGAAASEDHDAGAALGPPTVEFTLWAYITGYEDADGNKNPTLTVGHDEVVEITIINGDGMEHNLVIEAFDAHSDHVVAVGEQVEVLFAADTLGDFSYYCMVPGHQATMEGTLTVQEVSPGSTPAGISTPLLVGIIGGVLGVVLVAAVLLLRNRRLARP